MHVYIQQENGGKMLEKTEVVNSYLSITLNLFFYQLAISLNLKIYHAVINENIIIDNTCTLEM